MVSLETLNGYLALGKALFPCRERHLLHPDGSVKAKAKSPLTVNGFKAASLDPARIAEWHRQSPEAVWSTPSSWDYGVLDIDPRNKGDETMANLVAQHEDIPLCPTVRTGGGGWHHVLRFPEGTRKCKIGQGIEMQADGGYVVLPPSRVHIPAHEDAYRWTEKLSQTPIPDAPDWLVALAKGQPSSASSAPLDPSNPFAGQAIPHTLQSHPGAAKKADGGEGQHDTFVRLVGAELRRGIDPEQVREWAMAWAERCTPPYADWAGQWAGLVRAATRKGEIGLHEEGGNTNTTSVHQQAGKEGTNYPTGEQGELVPSGELVPVSDPVAGERGLVPSFPTPNAERGSEPDQPLSRSCKPTSPSGIIEYRDDSLLPPAPEDKGSQTVNTLHPDAYHGIIGDILIAVEPETEAHPAGVLVALLSMFGNAVGCGAWVTVGGRRHHPALYAAICSRTSGGKGDAYAVARYVIGKADLPYTVAAIAQGVGSGEGLVERVRDELATVDKKGSPIHIPGSPEKRCLLRLSELSRGFKAGRRESSTLSEMLREAWDGEPIHIPNRGGNALTATGYSVGVIGDITPGALSKLLSTGTESVDGYANRFLWVMTQRVRMLPFGGELVKADAFAPKLSAVLDKAKGMGEVAIGEDAKALWCEVYPTLLASADTVPHTDRARPYALRLSLIYALADGEKVIRECHLKAALALWDYCRESARSLFGSGAPLAALSEPDPLWLRLLNAITGTPGVKRSELTVAFKNTDKAEAIGKALEGLRAKGLAYSAKATGDAGGAPAERWYPGEGGGDDGLHEGRGGGASPSEPPNPFAGLVVGDAAEPDGEVSKQVSKSLASEEANPPHPEPELVTCLLAYLLTATPIRHWGMAGTTPTPSYPV